MMDNPEGGWVQQVPHCFLPQAQPGLGFKKGKAAPPQSVGSKEGEGGELKQSPATGAGTGLWKRSLYQEQREHLSSR